MKTIVSILSVLAASAAHAHDSLVPHQHPHPISTGPGTRWGDELNFLTAINSMPDDVKRQIRELERKLYDELDNLHLRLFRYLSKHRDQIEAPAEFWTEATIQ